MVNKPIVKQSQGQNKANPIESIKDFGSSTVRNIGSSVKDIGVGVMDQFFGGYTDKADNENMAGNENMSLSESQKTVTRGKREANIFNFSEHHEAVTVKNEIRRLVEQIKREIDYIRKADKSLLQEVKDIEKITLESVPEKQGIYHIRFLEIVLRTLQLLRQKIGESKTWMQALISKKKKRGSLFAARSKKSGTQYSLSQELSTARSVQ